MSVIYQVAFSLASATPCGTSSTLLNYFQPARPRPRTVKLTTQFRITKRTTRPMGTITLPTMVDRRDLNAPKRHINTCLQWVKMAPPPTSAQCIRPPAPCTNSCERSKGMQRCEMTQSVVVMLMISMIVWLTASTTASMTVRTTASTTPALPVMHTSLERVLYN